MKCNVVLTITITANWYDSISESIISPLRDNILTRENHINLPLLLRQTLISALINHRLSFCEPRCDTPYVFKEITRVSLRNVICRFFFYKQSAWYHCPYACVHNSYAHVHTRARAHTYKHTYAYIACRYKAEFTRKSHEREKKQSILRI